MAEPADVLPWQEAGTGPRSRLGRHRDRAAPELDGARVAFPGLHNGQHGQFLHLLASGVTPEYTWPYGMIANRMPVLWLRDRNGRWHTARPARSSPLQGTDDYLLWLRVVPPLDYGTPWMDVVATGRSAEVRARLPLSWKHDP